MLLVGIFGVRGMITGRERGHIEIWLLARYHMSLWASISKIFCNYFIAGSPSFKKGGFVGWFSLCALVFFHSS